MNKIRTHEDLLYWLFDQLARSEPQIQVTRRVNLHANAVCREVASFGYLVRSDCWAQTFDQLLRAEPVAARCGEKVVKWVSALYALAASHFAGTEIPIQN